MRIVLIGLRGSGKSTVGELLARRLSVPFYDTDQEIEARWGMLGAILTELGEDELRRREWVVIAEVAQEPVGVLAIGGGSLLDAENRKALAPWSAFWLDAPDPVLLERTAKAGAVRPPLTELEPLEEIEFLRSRRCDAYRALDPTPIDTHDKAPRSVVEEIAEQLEGGSA